MIHCFDSKAAAGTVRMSQVANFAELQSLDLAVETQRIPTLANTDELAPIRNPLAPGCVDSLTKIGSGSF